MQRRLFIKGLVGIAASLSNPGIAMAGGKLEPMQSRFAGSLFYTMEAPGRWAGKEVGHVPMIERNGNMIEVTTGHEMDGYTHYIVKHILLDENLDFVAETMFNPETDAPISTYDISGMTSVLYAVSLCNKHDAWLNRLVL